MWLSEQFLANKLGNILSRDTTGSTKATDDIPEMGIPSRTPRLSFSSSGKLVDSEPDLPSLDDADSHSVVSDTNELMSRMDELLEDAKKLTNDATVHSHDTVKAAFKNEQHKSPCQSLVVNDHVYDQRKPAIAQILSSIKKAGDKPCTDRAATGAALTPAKSSQWRGVYHTPLVQAGFCSTPIDNQKLQHSHQPGTWTDVISHKFD